MHRAPIVLGAGLGAVAAATWLFRAWLDVTNPTIAALTYVLIVFVVAASGRRWPAVATSIGATLSFNFFFLPPVGTLTIADPQNWIALFTFLVVSLAASHLSSVARSRAREALVRRDELARLFDVSRDVLVVTDGHQALTSLARSIARRFDLEFVAIAVPRGAEWDQCGAGALPITLDPAALTEVFAASQASLEFDASARTYAGHRTIDVGGHAVRLVPLRVGTRPCGLLGAVGRPVEAGTLDALGGVVALALERAQFLEDRKAGELAHQRDSLKTTLLASIGHDLRTPLTAIQVAAANIHQGRLTHAGDREQSELILTEADRLNRLFQNLIEMARLDAGAVASETRWVHPSEIIAAASELAAHSIVRHHMVVEIDQDEARHLDPRLTAGALAQLFENAAQYAPAGATITVHARMADDELEFRVRDTGPGIADTDLPHLFERFYRGSTAKSRVAGTGMGLWIARELLAVQGGRIWAENSPGGGAQFTIRVPASGNADGTDTGGA